MTDQLTYKPTDREGQTDREGLEGCYTSKTPLELSAHSTIIFLTDIFRGRYAHRIFTRERERKRMIII